ncbi:MAG TPA: S26 family signal peptidase [Sphingomonas sp.]|jgi:conjugative transfer signal peptidase TraF
MTRRSYATVTAIGAAVIGITAVIVPAPRLVWNATASVPTGLYTLYRQDHYRLGEVVAVEPPKPLAIWLAHRGYVPMGVPLMKHVAGVPGQTLCRRGITISVDGLMLGDARLRDSRGRPLPRWSGCLRIATGSLFLMNAGVPDSLDGRYFGPLSAATVVGLATPIVTRATPDAPLEWRLADGGSDRP